MTKFICIGGKAQNGKDTTAAFLKNALEAKGAKVLLTHYADLLKYMCKNYFGWDGNKDEAGRTLLQKVGTDGVRKRNENFWVDFVIDIVSFFPKEWDYVIVADSRFPNELSRIGKRGFKYTYVRVRRPNFKSPLTEEQQNHPSEIALDSVIPDHVIVNDGTLEDLELKARELCEQITREDRPEGWWEQICLDFDEA
ncbi:MAG: hypothetical protein IKP68_10025 [Clostridia bacterium]|nr:hypothetical protein [Clostridia bacterium]